MSLPVLRVGGRIVGSPLAMAVAAFAYRAAVALTSSTGPEPLVPSKHIAMGFEVGNIARAVASGHGFSSPFGIATGPTAWLPPVYPLLLAGIYKIFGTGTQASDQVALMANCLFSALVPVFLYAAGKSYFTPRVGILAGWIWVFLPTALRYSTRWVWDTTLSALLMAALFWYTLTLRDAKPRRSLFLGYAALWTFALLTNAAFSVLLPVFVLWVVWSLRRRGHDAVLRAGWTVLVVILGVSPWFVRNYIVFDRFVPFRSNFGLELYLGTNEETSDPQLWWRHPYENEQERALYVKLGEPAYMDLKKEEAFQFIREHPGAWLGLVRSRFLETWTGGRDPTLDVWPLATRRGRLRIVFNYTYALCGLLGVLVVRRSSPELAMPLAAVILLYPVVYYITHTNLRYRHPLEPVLVLSASVAVCRAAEAVYQRARRLASGGFALHHG